MTVLSCWDSGSLWICTFLKSGCCFFCRSLSCDGRKSKRQLVCLPRSAADSGVWWSHRLCRTRIAGSPPSLSGSSCRGALRLRHSRLQQDPSRNITVLVWNLVYSYGSAVDLSNHIWLNDPTSWLNTWFAYLRSFLPKFLYEHKLVLYKLGESETLVITSNPFCLPSMLAGWLAASFLLAAWAYVTACSIQNSTCLNFGHMSSLAEWHAQLCHPGAMQSIENNEFQSTAEMNELSEY